MTSEGAPPTRAKKSPLWTLSKWALALVAVGLLGRTLVNADLRRVVELLRGLGPKALLLCVPAVFVLVLETLAWRTSLTPLRRPLRYGGLAQVRLATEGVLMSLPGGVVLAEWLMPLLLRDKCGLPIAEGAAATAARKWLVMRSHGVYIAISAVLGWGFLAARSRAMIGIEGLPIVVLASALMPFGAAVAMELAMSRGAVAKRTWGLLARLPSRRLSSWLEGQRHAFEATDGQFSRIVNEGRATSLAGTALFVGAWLLESVEAWVIARALGAPLGFTEVLAFEAGLSLVRSLVFFAPSGVGVQDMGYVAFFGSMGVPDAAAIGGAFVVVKRAREIVWILVGWFFVATYMRKGAHPIAEVSLDPAAEASPPRDPGVDHP